MVTHYTAEVPIAAFHSKGLDEFMEALGFYEIETTYTDDWPCRWFSDKDSDFQVHITGNELLNDAPDWGLAHLCVLVHQATFDTFKDSVWCVRANPDSRLGRIWVVGPGGIRVELQVEH
jgi:hypothetical protein